MWTPNTIYLSIYLSIYIYIYIYTEWQKKHCDTVNRSHGNDSELEFQDEAAAVETVVEITIFFCLDLKKLLFSGSIRFLKNILLLNLVFV